MAGEPDLKDLSLSGEDEESRLSGKQYWEWVHEPAGTGQALRPQSPTSHPSQESSRPESGHPLAPDNPVPHDAESQAIQRCYVTPGARADSTDLLH